MIPKRKMESHPATNDYIYLLIQNCVILCKNKIIKTSKNINKS